MNGAAPRYERPALTKHQQVIAQAVEAILEPVLKDMSRKLDVMAEKIDTLIMKLDATEAAARQVGQQRGATPTGAGEDT
jgi:hypothetical protein